MIKKNGFTLIEVLISLTLLSVVLGAVYSSFFTVQRAIERFDNVSIKYHEARSALDIMRREIEGALLKDENNDDNAKNRTFFRIIDKDLFGKNTSIMNFTAFSFKGFSSNSISYFTRNNNGRLDLFKTESPAAIDAPGYTIDVMEGIEGFSVETLFNNKWVKTWDTEDTDKLPDRVKVSIEFDDNGKIVKLTEYAKPMIGRML